MSLIINNSIIVIKIKIILLYLFVIFASCNNPKETMGKVCFWDDCNVVASTVIENGDTVIVCDLNKVSQHKIVLSSIILYTLDYITLKEDSVEALISKRLSNIYTTENYMGFAAGSYFPFKLFKKDGTFVGNIGAIGQGRGEYVAVDAVYMDEVNDKIYLLPYSSDRILVYNFEAEYLSDIKLVERTMYGSSIRIDAKNKEVLITNSIVGNPAYFVWIQDFDGNFKQGVKPVDYFKNIAESFDESTLTRFRTNHIELFRLGYKNSTECLYHYDIKSNRLVPKFKLVNVNDNLSIMIHELPLHYIVEDVCFVGPDQDELETRKVLIDKKTLKGCIVDGFQILDNLTYNDYCLFTQMHGREFAILDMSSVVEERVNKMQKKTANILSLEKNISEKKKDKNDECSIVFLGKFKQK